MHRWKGTEIMCPSNSKPSGLFYFTALGIAFPSYIWGFCGLIFTFSIFIMFLKQKHGYIVGAAVQHLMMPLRW